MTVQEDYRFSQSSADVLKKMKEDEKLSQRGKRKKERKSVKKEIEQKGERGPGSERKAENTGGNRRT